MNEFDNLNVSDQVMYVWLCQVARQIDAAVAIINPNKGYTIEFVNQIFMQTTGYDEGDVIGSTLSLLQGLILTCTMRIRFRKVLRTDLLLKHRHFITEKMVMHFGTKCVIYQCSISKEYFNIVSS